MNTLRDKKHLIKYRNLLNYEDLTNLKKLCLEPFVNKTILKVYVSLLENRGNAFRNIEEISRYIDVGFNSTGKAVSKLISESYIHKDKRTGDYLLGLEVESSDLDIFL